MTDDNNTLYVIRGDKTRLDPLYACASNDSTLGKYVAIELDGNESVTKRMLFDNINDVEATCENYRQVHMDLRDNKSLLPAPKISHAVQATFDRFRSKSDYELGTLEQLSRCTRDLLSRHADETTFRRAADQENNLSSFTVRKTAGFTEYRGGMKNSAGLCSDLTEIVPHSQSWIDRLSRVNQGLDAVYKAAETGVSVDKMNTLFRGFLDPNLDKMHTSCIHSTGFSSNDGVYYNFEHLIPYDFVTIGGAIGAVGNDNDTALVYRSTKRILPPALPDPPSSPPPPSPPSLS